MDRTLVVKDFVPRPSNRERILAEGLKTVHQFGYFGASVRDIVAAAKVPQGSFTNHFVSKESFTLEALDLYFQRGDELRRKTLLNDALDPLERLRAYFDQGWDPALPPKRRHGCLLGNLSIEASPHSEALRKRLIDLFARWQADLGYCLSAAVQSGQLRADTDVADLAASVIEALEGAILKAKLERSMVPLERFKKLLFTRLLPLA